LFIINNKNKNKNKQRKNMNAIKKIGLTALAGSLVATSVYAGEMAVTGSAGIGLANQEKTTKGNGFSMYDEVTFSGSGEMDNGFTMAVSMQLDNSETGTGNMDNRSVTVGMGDMGTVTFSGHGGDSAFSAVDDVTPSAYGEAWDILGTTTTGGVSLETAVAKKGRISGTATDNMISYNNSTAVDGLSLTVSYVPSNGTQVESITSFAVAYSGVEGLTVGYAQDDNGLLGTSGIDYDTMYAKYAYGPVTVGYQVSTQDADGSTNDDEFTAMGVTYAISDSLSIGYNTTEYDDDNNTADEESTSISFSYTMGSMTIAGAQVSVDNQGADSAAINDTSGYALDLSFAF
jgi:outer membrane protein OmpU